MTITWKGVIVMNKVEQYIEKQNKIILEDREKTLISLGLVDKEYSPDDFKTYKYPEFDYVNGEKKYYRNVAIHVTDEEYSLIISKSKQVEEIKRKEEQEREKERNKVSYKIIKKWVPVFEKPKNESLFGDDKEQVDTGKSKAAKNIRITYYVLLALAFIGAIILDVTEETNILPYVAIGGIVESVLVEGLASILDYLAELTSIARNGYKYNETTK